jgi:phospholipase C
MAPIKHLFVLMMENRSFDHLFAFSGRPAVPASDSRWGMTAGFAGQSYWNVSGQGFAACRRRRHVRPLRIAG